MNIEWINAEIDRIIDVLDRHDEVNIGDDLNGVKKEIEQEYGYLWLMAESLASELEKYEPEHPLLDKWKKEYA